MTFCASATPPEMVTARLSETCRSFLPLLWAMKPPAVTRVSVASMTPSEQTRPTVVVP